MFRQRFFERSHCLTLTAALLFAVAPTRAAGPDEPAGADPAKATAVRLLDAGAKLFDAKDTKALVATYADDAVLTSYNRNGNTGSLDTSVKRGHAEIETVYRDLFKPDAIFHAENTVETARFIGTDLLLITGHFVVDTRQENPLKIPFIQVRVKQGDDWRILNLQLFVVPGN